MNELQSTRGKGNPTKPGKEVIIRRTNMLCQGVRTQTKKTIYINLLLKMGTKYNTSPWWNPIKTNIPHVHLKQALTVLFRLIFFNLQKHECRNSP